MKSYTYVHFGDTRPHQALLEIHPCYLFSKWCVIDLHLRTKGRIYSLKKNIFGKPSHTHHISRYFFRNYSGEEVVQQSSLFYRFTITKNQCNHLHNKNLHSQELYAQQAFCQATEILFAKKKKSYKLFQKDAIWDNVSFLKNLQCLKFQKRFLFRKCKYIFSDSSKYRRSE